MDVDVAVIGAGMIGSAAAFALAESGAQCALIGPDEPQGTPDHTTRYASHHDAGRITRSLASDPLWATVAQRSIACYRALEHRSGQRFFTECGAALVGPKSGPGAEFPKAVAATARALDLPHQRLDDAGLRRALPDYRFPQGSIGFFEPTGAGTIDPRGFLAALWQLGARAGMTRLRQTVTGLRAIPGGMEITCPGMARIRARHVILATGAYGGDGLWPLPVTLKRYARTVLLVEVAGDRARQLSQMPPVIWQPPGDGVDYYILPPLPYPDGRLRVKIGGDPADRVLHGPEAMNDWFRSPGAPDVAAHLLDVLTRLVPALAGVDAGAISSAACVTSFTPDSHPLITRDGAVTLALGGCGAAAKSALELGRQAADLARA